MTQTHETRRAGGAAGPGNSSCLAADSSVNAPKADVAQAKIELIAEDVIDTAGWMVSQLKVLPAQLASADYAGMIYTLRRARSYWKAISGSAADLVAANDERLSALRQGEAADDPF